MEALAAQWDTAGPGAGAGGGCAGPGRFVAREWVLSLPPAAPRHCRLLSSSLALPRGRRERCWPSTHRRSRTSDLPSSRATSRFRGGRGVVCSPMSRRDFTRARSPSPSAAGWHKLDDDDLRDNPFPDSRAREGEEARRRLGRLSQSDGWLSGVIYFLDGRQALSLARLARRSSSSAACA